MWPVFLFAAVVALLLAVLAVHLYIEVDDLREDGLIPFEVCSDVNTMSAVDACLLWVVGLTMFLSQRWLLVLWNLPLSILTAFLYYNRPPESGWGYHNPLNFRRKNHLTGLSRVAILKMVYHGMSIVLYSGCFISAIST